MDKIKLKPAFVDERGSILDIVSDDTIHHAGYLTCKKNSVRGKHFHKEQKQYTILLHGKIRILLKNLVDQDAKLEVIGLNEMEMILVPPFYYHSIEAIQDSECLILTSRSRANMGYENDTIRVDDIESFTLETN
jgi:dTDP-4-dehydrorhamnose 3,5-epimerase-like enzyme